MIKKYLKSKKSLWLSLVMPILLFLKMFFDFKANPIVCTQDLKTSTECNSFLEYLFSLFGIFHIFLILLCFIVSFLGILSLFFILNKKKILGYTFLVIFILIIMCALYLPAN